MIPSRQIERLIEIMAALRAPETGCSWDLAQTFRSIVPYAIEEAHEVADAVERGDREDLRDELGDLLLQVVFQARIAQEEGSFDFGGVVEAVTTKLIRRHPHIFGPKRDLSEEEVKAQWATIKNAEKAERAARGGPGASDETAPPCHLSGIPTGFPALLRAEKLQSKASEVGFDWNSARLVLDKIREETDEIEAVLDEPDALADEIGDLMFAVVNLARHSRVDPETALRATNRKFERRFGFVERSLARRGQTLEMASLAEMEDLWRDAKAHERGPLTIRSAGARLESDSAGAPSGPAEP